MTTKLIENVLNGHLSKDDFGKVYFLNEEAAIDFAEAYYQAKCTELAMSSAPDDELIIQKYSQLLETSIQFSKKYAKEGKEHDLEACSILGNAMNLVKNLMSAEGRAMLQAASKPPVVADDEIDTLKADAARWKQYSKTGLPTARYNELDSSMRIRGWHMIIKGKYYSAATANEATDMLIAVSGETP